MCSVGLKTSVLALDILPVCHKNIPLEGFLEDLGTLLEPRHDANMRGNVLIFTGSGRILLRQEAVLVWENVLIS